LNIDILQNLVKTVSKIDVNEFINELTERLKIMEQELVVDRFEGEFAVCEDRKTKQTHNIEISKLPENIKEGNVIKFENGKYIIDETKEQEISNRIKSKMDNLWN
jgi:nucleoid DNA-binding protein